MAPENWLISTYFSHISDQRKYSFDKKYRNFLDGKNWHSSLLHFFRLKGIFICPESWLAAFVYHIWIEIQYNEIFHIEA